VEGGGWWRRCRRGLGGGCGRGVEELVGDAEDSAFLHGFQVMPVALLDDAIEGTRFPARTRRRGGRRGWRRL